MTNYSELCVPSSYSIMDAIKVLDQTHERIVMILEDGILKGILTDSDVRRAILAHIDLNESVTRAMNTSPCVVYENQNGDTRKAALEILEAKNLDAIPVINSDGKLTGVEVRHLGNEEICDRNKSLNVPVVIMAGGKGTRLAPYTNVLPKPLIPIGEKTILERVIDSFEVYGCKEFIISVNYKKNLIKAFFQDSEEQRKVSFIEEEKFSGTAGSLYLLNGKLTDTFFVSNCDILLDVDYEKVLQFHKENKNKITILTSLKDYTIPYGIVELSEDVNDEGHVRGLREKPSMNFLVNTGVYVLEPEVLALIPEGEFFHITDLIEKCIGLGMNVGAYPITEKAWEDMGEIAGMESMILSRSSM